MCARPTFGHYRRRGQAVQGGGPSAARSGNFLPFLLECSSLPAIPRTPESPMSPFALIAGPIVLLGLPWLILPRIGQKPEVRGLLRLLWWLNRLYCALFHRLVVENEAP